MLLPALRSNISEQGRYIQGKLMRLCILTSVVTATAVMAQIGQMRDYGFVKGSVLRYFFKRTTITFAVAAGSTNA